MEAGYIKLHRCLSNNYLWQETPFGRGQAWVDLIILANHKSGHLRVRGNKIDVMRGQVGWSVLALSKRWGWSRGKVVRFLDELETAQQIVQQKRFVTSLITIVNYEQYQSGEQQTGQQTDSRRTADGQQTDTNKKVKKVKKVKNIKTFSSDILRLSDLLADLILHNNPTGSTQLLNGKREDTVARWAEEIDKIHRLDLQPIDHIEEVIRWCQQDSFWKSNILSGATLRKQWPKLSAKANKSHGSAVEQKPDWMK